MWALRVSRTGRDSPKVSHRSALGKDRPRRPPSAPSRRRGPPPAPRAARPARAPTAPRRGAAALRPRGAPFPTQAGRRHASTPASCGGRPAPAERVATGRTREMPPPVRRPPRASALPPSHPAAATTLSSPPGGSVSAGPGLVGGPPRVGPLGTPRRCRHDPLQFAGQGPRGRRSVAGVLGQAGQHDLVELFGDG